MNYPPHYGIYCEVFMARSFKSEGRVSSPRYATVCPGVGGRELSILTEVIFELRIQDGVCVERIAKVKQSSACGLRVCFCGRMSRTGFDASGLCNYADSHNAVILTYSFKSGSVVFDPTFLSQMPPESSAFRYSAPITRLIS